MKTNSLISALFLSLITGYVNADALNFVAGEKFGDKHTPWTVKLLSLHVNTGLSKFDFRVKDGWQRESIHISRILSIYFAPTPPTNKDISLRITVKEDIGGSLYSPRQIFVSDEFYQSYPDLLYVGAGRGRYVRGVILQYDGENETFNIKCLNKNNKYLEISNVYDFMITGWVR